MGVGAEHISLMSKGNELMNHLTVEESCINNGDLVIFLIPAPTPRIQIPRL
jgi:hypothetical protein